MMHELNGVRAEAFGTEFSARSVSFSWDYQQFPGGKTTAQISTATFYEIDGFPMEDFLTSGDERTPATVDIHISEPHSLTLRSCIAESTEIFGDGFDENRLTVHVHDLE